MKQQIPCGNITRAFLPRGIGTKEGEGVRSYALTDARIDGRDAGRRIRVVASPTPPAIPLNFRE